MPGKSDKLLWALDAVLVLATPITLLFLALAGKVRNPEAVGTACALLVTAGAALRLTIASRARTRARSLAASLAASATAAECMAAVVRAKSKISNLKPIKTEPPTDYVTLPEDFKEPAPHVYIAGEIRDEDLAGIFNIPAGQVVVMEGSAFDLGPAWDEDEQQALFVAREAFASINSRLNEIMANSAWDQSVGSAVFLVSGQQLRDLALDLLDLGCELGEEPARILDEDVLPGNPVWERERDAKWEPVVDAKGEPSRAPK